jgi:hypothetical protein
VEEKSKLRIEVQDVRAETAQLRSAASVAGILDTASQDIDAGRQKERWMLQDELNAVRAELVQTRSAQYVTGQLDAANADV